MDMTLQRFESGAEGIFSHLLDEFGNKVAESCTRAFPMPDGSFSPVTPPGRYLCMKGSHTLDGTNWFETYEITGVSGHTGVLFHKGNVQEDSRGCELLGDYKGTLGTDEAVLNSADAFQRFIALQAGATEFWLTVKEIENDIQGSLTNSASEPEGGGEVVDGSL